MEGTIISRKRKANSVRPGKPKLYRVVRSDGLTLADGVSAELANEIARNLYGQHNDLTYIVKPSTGELINFDEYVRKDTPDA